VGDLPDGEIGVRNSRKTQGPILWFTPDEWHEFIDGIRNREFDSFSSSERANENAVASCSQKPRIPRNPKGLPLPGIAAAG
jgi:hypothetical protein